jgi:hypothetical protein
MVTQVADTEKKETIFTSIVYAHNTTIATRGWKMETKTVLTSEDEEEESESLLELLLLLLLESSFPTFGTNVGPRSAALASSFSLLFSNAALCICGHQTFTHQFFSVPFVYHREKISLKNRPHQSIVFCKRGVGRELRPLFCS